MKLLPIAKYLEEQNLGIQEKTLFVTTMPTDKRGIVLIGPPGGTPIDHELPGWRSTEFRVTVRMTDYLKGDELANQAIAALTIHQEVTMDDILVKRCLPLNDPRPYRRSAGAFWEFEVEVAITYVLL